MEKLKQTIKKAYRLTPKATRPFLFCGVLSLILYLSFLLSPTFSDFYNRYIGVILRAGLALLTCWLPFSLAETFFMLMPVIVILLVVLVFRIAKKEIEDMVRYLICLLAALCFFLSTFTLGFAAGYRGTSLADKLGMTQDSVSAAELEDTARAILDEMDPLLDTLDYRSDGASLMPFSIDELNAVLQRDLKKAAKAYAFLPSFYSKIKPIVLSEPMTYTHISGVYTYFTGESNLNTNFPDYTLPFTAAHELSHQRGIAREDEANFMAFLICKDSENSYVRYSGYQNLLEYVLSALYRADSKRYYALLDELDYRIRYEIIAYNEFFDKYKDSTVADISGAINNSYLQSQGQSAGSKSYGMVVDLAVAYYKK